MELDLLALLRHNPVLTMFSTLGLGFLVGRIRIRGAIVGSTLGVLLAGLVLGHYKLVVSGQWGTVGFSIFMYAVGLSAGPRFFGVLRGATLKYIALAAVTTLFAFSLTSLISMIGFQPGVTAGMLAGALTSTPTLVAAQDAVQTGNAALPDGISPDEAVRNITVGYAITYIFGMAGLIGFIMLMPRIFRVDLHRESLSVSKQAGFGPSRGPKKSELPAAQAYEVVSQEFVGRNLKELDLGRI